MSLGFVSAWFKRGAVYKVGGPNKAHTLEKKCLQDSISQRLVGGLHNLAHIWVNLLGIVRLQNIDLQLIIYWHRGHFLR